MGITVALESLDAPVAHVALLEPGQTFGGAAYSAHGDAFVLTPGDTINAVAGADLWILAKGHAAGQADQLEAVEDRAVALVVDDKRAKFPAHLLAPVVAGVLHQIADVAGLWIAH